MSTSTQPGVAIPPITRKSLTKPSPLMWIIFVILIGMAVGMGIWFGFAYRNFKEIVGNERTNCPTYYCDSGLSDNTDPNTASQAWRLNDGKQEWQNLPPNAAKTELS